jgi:hypothetical protein
MEDKITAIFAGINDNARKFLKSLLNYPNGVRSAELSKTCGTTPAGFGGLLGAISKEGKKVGMSVSDLVVSQVHEDSDKRKYRWLAPEKLLVEHRGKLK